MFCSEYGPFDSSEVTSTHMTGWLPMRLIIFWIRCTRLTLEPTYTSAVSLVPSASTQQPLKPPCLTCLAMS